MVPHVPAWKRVGLKLKYAKETAEVVAPPASTEIYAPAAVESATPSIMLSKRSRTEEHTDAGSKTKKRKASSAKPVELVPPGANGVKTAETPITAPQPTSKVTRKKSVTFTPETKLEDGDRIAEIFEAWDKGELVGADVEPLPREDVASTAPISGEPDEASPPPLPAKDKKSKPKHGKKSDSTETVAYLQYLDRFILDKAHWKFNKAKQNDLLRNAFNIYRIPSSYTAWLLEYISGLSGAAARQRLREGAQEVLGETTGPNGRILTEAGEEDEDATRDQTLKRIRAEAVWNRLQEAPPPPTVKTVAVQAPKLSHVSSGPVITGSAKYTKFAEEPDVPVANGGTAKPARKRTRKSRTEVSSDEDSSSSDSDSDSDGSMGSKGSISKASASNGAGSSSSDSTSEREEDSGSSDSDD
ncbi:hypothetical protein B0A48_17210 [Cryoendolithus antarcticus]|uniref:WKF domain-containing protein n=1 Tax=Cryoendolithus antarcticus TaxID=1507870 RepID=A0A1V8SD59_9PEZI|nr:hypothetical protein B0A48_17210 [Cryoendolithus antarcticus]